MSDNDNSDNNDEDEVKCTLQLKKWKLLKYAPKFIEEGYEDIDGWRSLTIETLVEDVGMKKGHAKKFLQFYKETFGASNSNPKNVSGPESHKAKTMAAADNIVKRLNIPSTQSQKQRNNNASNSRNFTQNRDSANASLNDDLVCWLAVNKLSIIADKLDASGVSELSDMSSLVNKKDIEEFASDMQLPVLLRSRFIKAVSKLTAKNITKIEPEPEEDEDEDEDEEEEDGVGNDRFRGQLNEWGLGGYASNFVAEGYDDMDDWASLTMQSLTQDIAMKKGHAKKFLRFCNKLFADAPNSKSNSNSNTNRKIAVEDEDDEDEEEENGVRAQLNEWGLGVYASNFVDEGYDDMDEWPSLTLKILTAELAIKKGHAKKFVKFCKKKFGDTANSNSNSNSNTNSATTNNTDVNASNIDDDDELADWLKVNKLSKIAGKLPANDIDELSDLKSFVYRKNIEELASAMGLSPVLASKFINAVTKLNQHQLQPGQQPATAYNSNSNSNNNSNYIPAAPAAASSSSNFNYDGDDTKEGSSNTCSTDHRAKNAKLRGNNNFVPYLTERDVSKENKTIMVIGATGVGKTTLLNSMMNYLYDVQFTDKYRLKLIKETEKASQAISQTDEVTTYYLDPPMLGYNLTIVDTPGFGDSRGIKYDEKTTENIKKCFETQISEIDVICFVMCASLPRLTATQRYIFNQVLGIFGHDIKDNIFVLFTFADGKKPQALASVKADAIPNVTYFKFNNSAFALTEDGDEDNDDGNDNAFSQMFWAMGINAFKNFFEALAKVETKSLTLSRTVLNDRKQLALHIANITPIIETGIGSLDAIRIQMTSIVANEARINSSEDFIIQVKNFRRKKQPISGHFTTICDDCKWTCHEKCILTDSQKKGCGAMDKDTGYCNHCPGKCHWGKHKNVPYIWIREEYMVPTTVASLKKTYFDSKSKLSLTEQIIAGLLGDVHTTQKNLIKLIGMVCECLNALSKNALRPSVLTHSDYINKLIKAEEIGHKAGWEDRINALEKLKEKNNIVAGIKQGSYNPFEAYADVNAFLKKRNIKMKCVSKNKEDINGSGVTLYAQSVGKNMARKFNSAVNNVSNGLSKIGSSLMGKKNQYR